MLPDILEGVLAGHELKFCGRIKDSKHQIVKEKDAGWEYHIIVKVGWA